MQKEGNKIRDLFLSSFVESIIKEIYERKYKISGEIRNALQPLPSQKIQDLAEPNIELTQPKHQNFQVTLSKKPEIKFPLSKPNIPIVRKQISNPLQAKPSTPPISLPKSPGGKAIEIINLGKINPILSDPSVFSVESPGPGKNLIINRAGQIMPSPHSLTKEEIDTVMKEISDKTRIPLITGGVFKAAFKDLLITAVVSEYIGTRFLIQKRNPFQRY